MTCKRCGSNDTSRSKRRSYEKVFTAVIPVRPYRCSRCSKRQWRIMAWASHKKKYYPLISILIVLPILLIGYAALPDNSQDSRIQYFPIQASYSIDNEYYLRRSKAPEIAKSNVQPALSAAPEVHLWVGFRAIPMPVENYRYYIVHGNGMRLSFPKGIGIARSQ